MDTSLLMSTMHRDARQEDRGVVFTKGAPDVLLTRCTRELVDEEAAPIFGIKIPPGYRDWKLISVAHEEGDLNDIRTILGMSQGVESSIRDEVRRTGPPHGVFRPAGCSRHPVPLAQYVARSGGGDRRRRPLRPGVSVAPR
jgi:hypothetical protein